MDERNVVLTLMLPGNYKHKCYVLGGFAEGRVLPAEEHISKKRDCAAAAWATHEAHQPGCTHHKLQTNITRNNRLCQAATVVACSILPKHYS